MKSHKEFIQERLDDLALKYHHKFYCDLSSELRETLWAMANKDWSDHILEEVKC